MVEEFKRWYDLDPIVSKCVHSLESLDVGLKRQTAIYIVDEIINKPPYSEMLSDKVFELATTEDSRRRWYDFDEAVRIFIELLRHSSTDARRKIALQAVTFIEDLSESTGNSIALDD